jgi:quinol monooxygenase YgiN
MAFFVAIHQQAWPDHLDALLVTIKRSLTAARTLHPGRRSTRVFQRLDDPTQLLALSEWASKDAFEQFRQWPTFADTIAVSGPPPRIELLEPLRRFERIEQRVGVVACSMITASAEDTAVVQEYLLEDAHREVKSADGLIRRELFRSRTHVGQLLLVHSWRSLADLERFRARYSAQAELARLGATVERFTGMLTTEFSVYAR